MLKLEALITPLCDQIVCVQVYEVLAARKHLFEREGRGTGERRESDVCFLVMFTSS